MLALLDSSRETIPSADSSARLVVRGSLMALALTVPDMVPTAADLIEPCHKLLRGHLLEVLRAEAPRPRPHRRKSTEPARTQRRRAATTRPGTIYTYYM